MIEDMAHGIKQLPYAHLFIAGAILILIAESVMLRLGEIQTLISTCLWCFVATVLGFMLDRSIIYPYHRSTIRKSFPTIFVRFERHSNVSGLQLTVPYRTTSSSVISRY